MFCKAQLRYINPLYVFYIWLRVRVAVSNVWYGITSVLEKIPVEHRDKLLRGVE